jgi:hypothetical protein
MKKNITTIGFLIPGNDSNELNFDHKTSLMDADVLLISPESLIPSGSWVSFTSSDGGCYNVQASNQYRETLFHLKKEIVDLLKAGKTVFVFLTQERKQSLSHGVTSPRKGQHSYSTYLMSNYEFMPIDIGRKTSAAGKLVQSSGNPIFNNFYSAYKSDLTYELYVEDPKNAITLFTGKDQSKILGAIYKVGAGHLITLPLLKYDEDEFTETRDGKYYWTADAEAYGNDLIKILLEIDEKLSAESNKSIAPAWVSNEIYRGKREHSINQEFENNIKEIETIQLKNQMLEMELEKEKQLKDLLFEQGKPLEDAVILALKILGYSAENYDDGKLEMDQIIISPEGNRYIGENEGKDTKDINVTKFRQLVDALNADFARDEVTEKAFGILFGNAERLKDPSERTLDFTEKCKSGAERERIALVKTIDLYKVAKYLKENEDLEFAKSCREAIHNGLGKIVQFPQPLE